jgi:hypothetical protein
MTLIARRCRSPRPSVFVVSKLPNLLSFLTFFGRQTSILISRARENRTPPFVLTASGVLSTYPEKRARP